LQRDPSEKSSICPIHASIDDCRIGYATSSVISLMVLFKGHQLSIYNYIMIVNVC
jgi:hypothetical protein